jgi:glutamate-1-semialdehyde 2,1-aminomutase
MAVFGKALGNGYAITAIIGKREIMEHAQDSFISSTFWTERIGPAAALKTLEVMERTESWNTISDTGKKIGQRWIHLADQNNLKIVVSGLSALTGYQFRGENALAYQTLVTQEMLKKGYLATGNVYVSIAHSAELLDGYFDELEKVFDLICECENGQDIMSLLDGPICKTSFERLN